MRIHPTTVLCACGCGNTLTTPSEMGYPRRFIHGHNARGHGVWHSVAERFWKYVNKDGPLIRADLGPCWTWTGAISLRTGYGKFSRISESEARQRYEDISAHRISWELHNGKIPNGFFVLHHCDHRSCVRPDHLFLGTREDNTADMVAKGRSRGGNKPPIPATTVSLLRSLWASGVSLSKIAHDVGLSIHTVRKYTVLS